MKASVDPTSSAPSQARAQDAGHPSGASVEGMLDGADLGPGLGREFPLRFELALNPQFNPEVDPHPFLVMSDMGRNSRVFLGRIITGDRTAERYVAIKFQTPRPGIESGEEEHRMLSHKARERHWLRELGHYLILSGYDGFTPLLFVEKAAARSGDEDRPRPWPPLIYCNFRKVLFAPLTQTGRSLVTCRDDGLLRSQGLPAYSESPETFLYNLPDIEAGNPPVYYQSVPDPESVYAGAATFLELLDAQSRVAGLPGAEAPKLDSSARVIEFGRVAAEFACMVCPEREVCYPNGPYAERLEPFTLEDSNALVLELNQFHYDEFCDLLGGIDWRSFQNEYLGEGAGPGQLFRLSSTEGWMESGRRFMFKNDGTGIDALETFKLKWALFTQACRAVFEYQRRCGVAHLRIEPRHVMIRMDDIGESLPAMWQFRARLISLGSRVIETPSADGEREEIFALPMSSNPVYDATIIRNSSFGILQRASFILKSIDDAPQGGKSILKGEIHHDGIGMPWLSLKDRIKVILRNVYGMPGEFSFMSQRDPDEEYSQQILFVKSHPIEIKPAQLSSLKRISGTKVHNIGFILYPIFHVPCDIYSLGMLLFRTLVVNDKQSIGDVALGLDEVNTDLQRMGAAAFEEGLEGDFWRAMLQARHRYNVAEIFSPRQVFYGEDDRAQARPNSIPENIWAEAMVLGLQLTAAVEGFSVCANHGDFDARYPAQSMEPVIRRAEEIMGKIDAALLSTSRRNAEVRAALEAVL